ncbi:MAG: hypothetical protein ACXWLW_02370 [Rhizomicrobium sp.]
MIVLLCAVLLGIASLAVWFLALGARPPARVHLRFASMLFAALAAAAWIAPPVADEVALIVAAIALPVLAFGAYAGFEKPLAPMPATLLLGIVCLGGLAAAATGIISFALVPASLSVAAILLISARQFDVARVSSVQGMLSALSLLAAASSFALEGTGSAHLLFSAAGLLGVTLALSRASNIVVEEQSSRDLRHSVTIGNAG